MTYLTTTKHKTNLLFDYYKQSKYKLQLIHHLRYKETVFMNKNGMIIRGIKANHHKYLDVNMKHYHFNDKEYNIYNSIATFRDFPLFSWKSDIREKQYRNWTDNKLYLDKIVGYDFYMDFDNKGNDEEVKQECITVCNWLKDKRINFKPRFSGSGYHLKSVLALKNQNPKYCRLLAEKLIKKFDLKTVDKSIYRWQGIIKSPYSIDCKTMRVCLPLNLESLKNFNPIKASIYNFLK